MKTLKKILITGASGFLGSALFNHFKKNECTEVFGLTRNQNNQDLICIPDLGGETNFSEILESIDVIIHTAARAHIMQDSTSNPLEEYRKINRDGTLNLAQQASKHDVRRFIFISSIGVNGKQTEQGRCFAPDDIPQPEDAYGVSKYEAEQGLLDLAGKSKMQVVIIRPPLIYGHGAKGNFSRLMQWIERGIPLPLGAINNQRSFIGIDNLVDLISICIEHPAAANQIFLASDGEDLSTTDLLVRLAKAGERPSRLLPVPEVMLKLGLSILGKKEMAQRLLSSLQIDITKTRELLNWTPSVSIDEGFRRCFRDAENP